MKRLKSKPEDDLYEPLPIKGKIAIGLLISSPFLILGGSYLLGEYFKAHPDPLPQRPAPYYYKIKEPDIVNKPPIFQSGIDQAIPAYKNSNGVVLHLNGVTINTGADADEILQQLTFDYQDLFDQYGGADELY